MRQNTSSSTEGESTLKASSVMQVSDSGVGDRDAGVWCDPGLLSWVRVSGRDAVRFVDSFTTAAVSRVTDGHGCEGFFTDVRGQVLCLAGLLRCGDASDKCPAVEIFVDGDGATQLAEHLERYHIREQIEIDDVSEARSTVGLLGRSVLPLLEAVASPPDGLANLAEPFDHVALRLSGGGGAVVATRLVRCDWAGPQGWLLSCPSADAEKLQATLREAGFTASSGSLWEQRRIESGTPRACDLLPKTLPQELGRDSRAISFTKGCYLGQETVARLDALGHVNRRLVGLAIDSETVPLSGAVVSGAGDTIGQITSSCFSTALGRPLALAILPVKALLPGIERTVEGRAAETVQLPCW